MTGTPLAVLGWHLFGGSHGRHGHHGPRVLVLIAVLAVAVIGVLWLVRHARTHRPSSRERRGP